MHVLVQLPVFMALPSCATDARKISARVSVFGIPPRAEAVARINSARVFIFEVPPLRRCHPSEAVARINDARVFVFAPAKQCPEQQTRVWLFPWSRITCVMCVRAAAARTTIRTLPIETVTRNTIQCFRVTCSHSLFCMNSMAWVLSCFLLSIVLQSLAPTKHRRNTW